MQQKTRIRNKFLPQGDVFEIINVSKRAGKKGAEVYEFANIETGEVFKQSVTAFNKTGWIII